MPPDAQPTSFDQISRRLRGLSNTRPGQLLGLWDPWECERQSGPPQLVHSGNPAHRLLQAELAKLLRLGAARPGRLGAAAEIPASPYLPEIVIRDPGRY